MRKLNFIVKYFWMFIKKKNYLLEILFINNNKKKSTNQIAFYALRS